MTAASREATLFAVALALSLCVNSLIFSLQPLLSGLTSSPPDLAHLGPVKLVPFPRERLEEMQPERTPEKTPEPKIRDEWVAFDTPTAAPVNLDMTLELPALRLEIDPRLSAGVPITPSEGVDAPVQAKPQPRAFSLAEVDQPPAPLFQLEPEYPFSAKRSNISGKVNVLFLVDHTGAVLDVKILSAEPEGVFEKSVTAAVEKWKFTPGRRGGEEVRTWVATTIRFELD